MLCGYDILFPFNFYGESRSGTPPEMNAVNTCVDVGGYHFGEFLYGRLPLAASLSNSSPGSVPYFSSNKAHILQRRDKMALVIEISVECRPVFYSAKVSHLMPPAPLA